MLYVKILYHSVYFDKDPDPTRFQNFYSNMLRTDLLSIGCYYLIIIKFSELIQVRSRTWISSEERSDRIYEVFYNQ